MCQAVTVYRQRLHWRVTALAMLVLTSETDQNARTLVTARGGSHKVAPETCVSPTARPVQDAGETIAYQMRDSPQEDVAYSCTTTYSTTV